MIKLLTGFGESVIHIKRQGFEPLQICWTISKVARDGMKLKNIEPRLQNIKAVVLNAVKNVGEAYQYASQELRCDRDVFIAALLQQQESGSGLRGEGILEHIGWKLRGDKETMIEAIQLTRGRAFRYASEKLRGDRDVLKQAITWTNYYRPDENPLLYTSKELKEDREVVLALVEKMNYQGECFKDVSPKLQDDKDVVLQAVKHSSGGRAFKYASDRLKGDRDVVLAAIALSKGRAFEHADLALRKDRDVVLAAIGEWKIDSFFFENDRSFFDSIDKSLWGDRDVLIAAINKGYIDALQYASGELQQNDDVIFHACVLAGQLINSEHSKRIIDALISEAKINEVVENNFNEFCRFYESGLDTNRTVESLKYNYTSFPMIRDALIRVNPSVLRFFPGISEADMLAIVKDNGMALRYAYKSNSEFIRNTNIVTAAVTNNGLALKYADASMKNNREIVEAAVTNNDLALQYASNEMQQDPLILEVIKTKKAVSAFVYSAPEARGRRPNLEVFFPIMHLLA